MILRSIISFTKISKNRVEWTELKSSNKKHYMQQSKQIIDKVKEYNQMIAKHYERTPTITAILMNIDFFVEKKQWTKNNWCSHYGYQSCA